MRNRIKNFFNIENAIRIYRERPLALLTVTFAVLSLYSMLSLLMLVDAPVEKKRVEKALPAGEEVGQKRMLSLKRKIVLLEERAVAALVSRGSSIIPFGCAADSDDTVTSMVENPPKVRVRALGKRGMLKVALIDIDGEESKLMREQDIFGTIGRVRRIDNEGVTWIWGSKEFRTLIWE